MPQIIGVRVHFNDTRPPVLHKAGRKWYAEEDGYLRVTDENVRDVAVHASMDWAWAELVHGEPAAMASAWVKGGGPGCGCGCRDHTEDPAEQPEGSAFTWPYDPTSGTVSTDDAVEQAKHEAADRIGKAQRIVAAERAVALARKEQADAAVAHGHAVMDAEDALAGLLRELDDAA